MELKWTKHGVVRGYTRAGRYGMDVIEKKIIDNVNKAIVCRNGHAAIPFKLGRKHFEAVLAPLDDSGTKALVITTYLKKDRKKLRKKYLY